MKFCLELVCSYFSLEDCCSKLSDVDSKLQSGGRREDDADDAEEWRTTRRRRGGRRGDDAAEACIAVEDDVKTTRTTQRSGGRREDDAEVTLQLNALAWFLQLFQGKPVESRLVMDNTSLISIFV